MTRPITPGVPKKSPRPTDPTLRLAAELDRIVAEMPEQTRKWIFGWLESKYGKKDENKGCNAPPI